MHWNLEIEAEEWYIRVEGFAKKGKVINRATYQCSYDMPPM